MPNKTSDQFTQECTQKWTRAIVDVFGNSPPSHAEWSSAWDCCRVLKSFLKDTHNHVHLPTGGGVDVHDVENSAERGCLDFILSDRSYYVGRPDKLIFEHIERAPINSFLLLELGTLEPSGVYEESDGASEELLSLDGDYQSREVWDRGYELDEDGEEVPLSENAMLVVRFFRGKMLVVSKKSIWNGIPATYDGRHSNMTAKEIRDFIEGQL